MYTYSCFNWMCMYKYTSAEKNSHLYFARHLLPVSLLLFVFFFGKVFVFECVCSVSNYYRAEQWGTIVWMLQVTRSLPVACAGLLKTKMPPNQIVVSIICFINAAGIEYGLLYCCILYWMHITEGTDHDHATSTVGLRQITNPYPWVGDWTWCFFIFFLIYFSAQLLRDCLF